LRESCLEEISLICPCCRRAGRSGIIQSPLVHDSVVSREAGYIIEGFLVCANPDCRRRFPIVAGVPIILKDLAAWQRTERYFFAGFGGMGAELGSFFADLAQAEPEIQSRALQLGAYLGAHYHVSGESESKQHIGNDRFWQQLITGAAPDATAGYSRALDMGCNVGRFTFEQANFSDLAIGIDIDFPAVATAARFQRTAEIRFAYPERARKASSYLSPFAPRDNVLFLVADALNPPFPAAYFDLVSSVNLLDNVAVPLQLIGQMNALLRPGGILHHCSPYAWRANISHPVEWLETEDIAAPEMMRRILTKQYLPELDLEYEILSEIENVPWVLEYGLRQKSVFSVHMLGAGKISGRDV